MLYITVLLLSSILMKKFIILANIPLSGSCFFIPLSYFLADIVAEVYGYKLATRLICCAFICIFIFDTGLSFIANSDTVVGWSYQPNQDVVFVKLIRVFVGYFIAINLNTLINTYIVLKWKFFIHIKYFWLRSILFIIINNAIFITTAFSIVFIGEISLDLFLSVIVSSYIFNVTYAIVIIWPTIIIIKLLKITEEIDDCIIKFNPFFIKP